MQGDRWHATMSAGIRTAGEFCQTQGQDGNWLRADSCGSNSAPAGQLLESMFEGCRDRPGFFDLSSDSVSPSLRKTFLEKFP
jgi:hypothetical protein